MVKIFKISIDILAIIIALPFALLGRISDYFNSYVDVALFLSNFPFFLGKRIRYWFYKYTLKSLGKNVTFMHGSFCQYTTTIIGNNVLVGIRSAVGECTIGDYVMIGGFVNIISGTKQHIVAKSEKPMMKLTGGTRTSITIGTNVWIGSNAVIAASICDDCCIGAGALVVKDAANSGIYVSAPSSFLKSLPEQDI